MKLNEQSKNELRKEIEEAVKSVPEGQRIHLDKELLDDLIFFKGKNKQGTVIKVPIWTGEFLRKIDLSEISFENVLFQNSFASREDSLEKIMNAEDVSKFIKICNDKFTRYHVPFINNNGIIDFSYTNANIDFSKIYGSKIVRCNFEGLDFSNANGKCLEQIYASNFSNTNIRINFKHNDLMLLGTDFSNNDFSYARVDTDWFNFKGNFRLDCCNFSNTELHINYDAPQISSIDYEYSKEYFYKSCLVDQIKRGHLDGCFINGKKILSLKERKAIAQEKNEEYEKLEEDLIFATTSSIDEQIKSFKGK